MQWDDVMETMLIALLWAFLCGCVCAFIHGAKKARRKQEWVEEARRNVKWPAHTE
jgi:hypothetical protein